MKLKVDRWHTRTRKLIDDLPDRYILENVRFQLPILVNKMLTIDRISQCAERLPEDRAY